MAWKDLSVAQRSQLINIFRRNGVTSLSDMRQMYDGYSSPASEEGIPGVQQLAPVYATGGPKKGVNLFYDIPKDETAETLAAWALPIPNRQPELNSDGSIKGVSNITSAIKEGRTPVYSKDFVQGAKIYRDSAGEYYRIMDNAPVDKTKLVEIPYAQIRSMLPKKEYIGGNDYRIKTVMRIPGFTNKIWERAKEYGVDPNVLLHRIMKEGWIDQNVQAYNALGTADQRDYWNSLWDKPVAGYSSFGLDYAGSNLMKGLYSLKDENARWSEMEFSDAEGSGNSVRRGISIMAENLPSAIEILAADMAYRQRNIRQRYGKEGPDLNTWTNASFNLGVNHKDLNNERFIRSNYTYPDYYTQYGLEHGNGGSIHIKPSHRGRLTELKKRTGKSEAELYNDGNPAHKKMVVFARNARKWKHEDGGLLKSFDMGGDKDNDALAAAIIERVKREEAAKARAEGAPMMGEKTLVEEHPLGAALMFRGLSAPVRGAVQEATTYGGVYANAFKRFMKDLPAFEFMDRLPTLFGGKRATELGGDASQWVAEKIAGHKLSPMEERFARVPGEFAAGIFPGAAGDILMSKGARAMTRGIEGVNNAFRFNLNPEEITSVAPAFAHDSFLYRLKQATSPVRAAASTSTEYTIDNLGGGYMLRSLMRGNPLEKQISKQGTVNVNNIRALINKGGKVEQAVVDKVLASEEFAGKKSIDYNKFRKAVQDELITYERTPVTEFEKYGIERLGFYDRERVLTDALRWDPEMSEPIEFLKDDMPELSAYTFSSSRIPKGSPKHYYDNTLGHSRTYTTAEEPDVLHVMESQSDWAQEGIGKRAQGKYFDKDNNDVTDLVVDSWTRHDYSGEHWTPAERFFGYNRKVQTFGKTAAEQDEFDRLAEEWAKYKKLYPEGLHPDGSLAVEYMPIRARMEEIVGNQTMGKTRPSIRLEKVPPAAQEIYLSDNYTSRQIQENLRYAAERGQTKMRYPTRETAAKIEGYPEREAYFDAQGNDITTKGTPEMWSYGEKQDKELKHLREAIKDLEAEYTKWLQDDEYVRKGLDRDGTARAISSDLREAQISRNNIINENEPKLAKGYTKKTVYDYEDILRKYTEFPKQYKKLFKSADVRIVTDPKGNTWYEVDVPKDYLKQEWQYAEGGLLKK